MKKALFIAASFALPALAFAQTGTGDLGPLRNLVRSLGDILNILIPVLIAAALVVFFWGLVKYVWSGGKDKDKGKNVMIAGLLSLFVMVSVWGIIRLAQNALGVGQDQIRNTPCVPQRGSSVC